MRKIILFMQVSLDGFFEGPDRDISWHMVDDELHRYVNAWLATMSAFLEGRVSYELMEGFWPTADQDPAISAPMAEFAQIWRDMPKVVYSRTLTTAAPNATVVRDVVPEEVLALKSQPGGDMAVGGADLADTFRRLGLIDEYWVYVQPVLVGRGRSLFKPADNKAQLRLLETRVFGNGVALLRYAA